MASKNQYSFQESGLRFTSADVEKFLPFNAKIKLCHSSLSGALSLKGPGVRIPLDLPLAEQQEVLLEFFRRWKARQPEEAKKSAFDYVDGQKGFVAVAFVSSALFCLPLAVGLLADSRNQFVCTKVLQEHSVLSSMDVVKFKKKRKGHYILDLEFTAPNGVKIQGRDQVITTDETSIPRTVPVVYSPERPECWSLTPNLEGESVNWAKRRFFGTFTLLFGAFFLFVSLYGMGWSVSRWMRPRPFKAELKQLFQL